GCKVTTWLHVMLLLQRSVACQVRVTVWGEAPLVTVLKMVNVKLVPLQASLTLGGSKLQVDPGSTVLLVAQLKVRQVLVVQAGIRNIAASPMLTTGLLGDQTPPEKVLVT